MNIRNLIVLFRVTTGLFAQSVMGTVFDANSRPLEGANVVLVGTDLGDIANDSGAYAMISVPAGTYDLTAYAVDSNHSQLGDTAETTFIVEP